MNQVGAGWYPDPGNSSQLRWWNGAAWTEHVAPAVPVHQQFDVHTQVPAAVPIADETGHSGESHTSELGQAAGGAPRRNKVWNAGTWVTLGACVALAVSGVFVIPALAGGTTSDETETAETVLANFVAAAERQDESWRQYATPQYSSRVLVGAPIGGEKNSADAVHLDVTTHVGELEYFKNESFGQPVSKTQADLALAQITIDYTFSFNGEEQQASVEQDVWLSRPSYYGDDTPSQAITGKQATARGPWRVFRLANSYEVGAKTAWSTTLKDSYWDERWNSCHLGTDAYSDFATSLRIEGELSTPCQYADGGNVIFEESIVDADLIAAAPAFDPIYGVGAPSEILGVGDTFGGVETAPLMQFPFQGRDEVYVLTYARVVDESNPSESWAVLVAVQTAADPMEGNAK